MRRPRRTTALRVTSLAPLTVSALLIGLLVPVVLSSPAEAAPGPSADLFVTSPPDPVPATPGTVAAATLTVGNIGTMPLSVRITNQQVQLLDNGQTRFLSGPDPQFAGRISIAPNALTLAPRSEQKVSITVTMPKTVPPDDYFLGFLVSPVINSSSVAAVNDIGGLVVLDVPGPRNRKLTAAYVGPSWLNLSLSSSASGIVRAKSVGRSTAQFTTTMEINGWPAPKVSYFTKPLQLLPPGLSQDIPVHASTWLGIGWYSFHTTLVYNLTERTTGEVSISRTVVIVNPLWFLVIPAVFGFWMWRRRRRRHPRRQPRHGVKRSDSSVPKHNSRARFLVDS
jgi:uncharacterized membrane protein